MSLLFLHSEQVFTAEKKNSVCSELGGSILPIVSWDFEVSFLSFLNTGGNIRVPWIVWPHYPSLIINFVGQSNNSAITEMHIALEYPVPTTLTPAWDVKRQYINFQTQWWIKILFRKVLVFWIRRFFTVTILPSKGAPSASCICPSCLAV